MKVHRHVRERITSGHSLLKITVIITRVAPWRCAVPCCLDAPSPPQAVTCDEWRPGRDPLRRLCHTCHLLKPPRAKHCRVTDRCVEDFDHYCPYIYNSVGRRNRTFFLGFLASLSVSCWLGVLLCVDWFCVAGRSLLVGVGFVFTVVIGLVSGTMACTCLYLAALNVTTNERAAQERRGSPAPFDRGVLANLLEFFHLLSPGPGAERRTLDELRVV
ncbi:palmitoyltransferase ZDHHC12 [Amia ocellicauda]|uniref:palmitoyltransferase ZDHHC12 n=1 Tax=Amia ocellicauda TaxID=2972642 RepID=UPI0034645926